ncbi:hypothetical protein [Halomarina pelagica]|uniref:hypothetical protein n=1 Tax=Halomarina pelagica TaxID=2961599 RepID=UPI0020C37587|nr:hypothetical protein [Halomarina sp. BND7]
MSNEGAQLALGIGVLGVLAVSGAGATLLETGGRLWSDPTIGPLLHWLGNIVFLAVVYSVMAVAVAGILYAFVKPSGW